jgi:hypothetical protein
MFISLMFVIPVLCVVMFVIPVLCVVMFGNVFDRLFSILKQPTSLEDEGLSLVCHG